MQNFINSVLKYLKYPLGILCLFFTYPLMAGLFRLIVETFNINIFTYFLLPIFGVMFLWSVIPGLNGSTLTIFGH